MRPEKLETPLPPGLAAWRVRLDAPLEPAWPLLDDAERQRAGEFRAAAAQRRYVLARAALRCLLGDALGCGPAQVMLRTGKYGKPALAGVQGLWFNVAHSGDYALIALSSQGPVGIDIEWQDERLRAAEEEALTVRERAAPMDFFARWVGKEAVLKAIGVGIGTYLQELSVLALEQGRYRLAYGRWPWPSFAAASLPAPPGYAAAIAWISAESPARSR
ncbi:4'-phosphopantetheinyl transferase family protein [Pseudoduganella violaceinigra]|uniref:4'-phosphopantetheinyl transferase family protein n=1 Tax=Pseudoduganella violaceinigra TaxID=246602 RepID=UPI0004081AAE|nr:4'-phosphopantetheinyl transferase superfamily protein [Pseudoduganella violaceinigra]